MPPKSASVAPTTLDVAASIQASLIRLAGLCISAGAVVGASVCYFSVRQRCVDQNCSCAVIPSFSLTTPLLSPYHPQFSRLLREYSALVTALPPLVLIVVFVLYTLRSKTAFASVRTAADISKSQELKSLFILVRTSRSSRYCC